MTKRIAAVWVGSMILAPATLFAQPETDEPEPPPESCPPHACCFDTDQGRRLCTIFDFLKFQNLFILGDPCACDMDTTTGPGVCDVFDFLAYQDEFISGILFGVPYCP